MSDDRAKKAAEVRRGRIEEAMLDSDVGELAEGVVGLIVGSVKSLSSVQVQAMFNLVRNELSSHSMISSSPRGRGRAARSYATPGNLVF